MSVSSAMSQMSINYDGREMSLEAAVDECFHDLQQYLNDLQVSMRTFACLPEQSVDENEDFQLMTKYQFEISDHVDGMSYLFDELHSLGKQITGKPPNKEMKEWYAAERKARDIKKKFEKEQEKVKKDAAKIQKMAMSSINE